MIKPRIAVAAQKGGVGKTSIACGIASILLNQNQKVLLIDLDPQSNAAYALGVAPTAPGTAKLLLGQNPPLAASPGLDVLPGGPNLTDQQFQALHPEDLADAIASLNYDAVLLDCSPSNESPAEAQKNGQSSCPKSMNAEPLTNNCPNSISFNA
jgi:chromosome partitioning protein